MSHLPETDDRANLLADLPALLTVDELARLLRLTPKGIYALVASRRVPHVKIANRLRFRRDEVLRWLEESRVPAIER